MSRTYEEVALFFKKHEAGWRQLAIDIEKEIVNARDYEGVPVYLTKMRIKKPASAYLKTKRKTKANLDNITDWIGLRVLCLFQQDIALVHNYLTRLFSGLTTASSNWKHFGPVSIKEIVVFNWDANLAKQEIERTIVDILNATNIRSDFERLSEHECKFIYSLKGDSQQHVINYRTEYRGTGYKSVHYSIDIGITTIEVQLRTLLQDVWGELEHALSYKKGKIHPHITNSFQLLSRELEAKDILVSQLREISEKERSLSLYARVKSGPTKWLSYEASFLKKLPITKAFRGFLCEYFSNFSHDKNNRTTRTSTWCERVSVLLDKGKQIPKKTSPASEFFFDMELAFLAFCRGDIDIAEGIYEKNANDRRYRNRWVVQLRLGEIHVVRGEIEEALVRFDQCESLLRKIRRDDRDLLGEFFAKQKLANVYWSLGDEYIDIAVGKVEEAEGLYQKLKRGKRVSQADEASLLNNLCYFALEKYIKLLAEGSVEKRFQAGNEAERRYSTLDKFVKDHTNVASSNIYDTLAWYAFQKYKVLKGANEDEADTRQAWLKKAYSFMEMADGKSNVSASPLTSVTLQRDHVQEIMSAYDTDIRGSPH